MAALTDRSGVAMGSVDMVDSYPAVFRPGPSQVSRYNDPITAAVVNSLSSGGGGGRGGWDSIPVTAIITCSGAQLSGHGCRAERRLSQQRGWTAAELASGGETPQLQLHRVRSCRDKQCRQIDRGAHQSPYRSRSPAGYWLVGLARVQSEGDRIEPSLSVTEADSRMADAEMARLWRR